MSKILSKFSKLFLGMSMCLTLKAVPVKDKPSDQAKMAEEIARMNSFVAEIQAKFALDLDPKKELIEFSDPITGEKISLNLLQIMELPEKKFNMLNTSQKQNLLNKLNILKILLNVTKSIAFYQKYKDKMDESDIKDVKALRLGLLSSINHLADLAVIKDMGGLEGIKKSIVKFVQENPDITNRYTFIAIKDTHEAITGLNSNLNAKKKGKGISIQDLRAMIRLKLGTSFNEEKSNKINQSIEQIKRSNILPVAGIAALKGLKNGEISDIIKIDDTFSCLIYLSSVKSEEVDIDKEMPGYLNRKATELMSTIDIKDAVKLTPYCEGIFGNDLDKANEEITKQFTDFIMSKVKKKDDKDPEKKDSNSSAAAAK